MPKVSIIVPVYNAQKTIGRCIDSVLGQTYPDFELILLNDGSTDESGEIIRSYAQKDARIVPVNKDNTGVSDTRNVGLSMARGEYIQFMDADDWITPDATRMFIRTMEDHAECDMVIADFYRVIGENISQKGDIEDEKLLTREEYADEMMKSPADFYYGVLWNKFYRRSIIEEHQLQMDVQLDWSEDFIFNMEYVLHTRAIYALKVPVYYYVKTEGSLVSQGGASISKTVRMKLDVIEYYSSFYKDIYKEGGYLVRSPVIYSFLLNFARDGGVNPVAPEKRLGQERVDVRIDPSMKDNPFALNFYEDRLLERALERLQKGYDLEEKDAQILLYLKLAGGSAATQEIISYTGLTARSLAVSLQRLSRKKLITKKRIKKERTQVTEESIASTIRVSLGEESGVVSDALDRAFRDIEELRFRDFSKEEIERYKELSGRAAQNVRKALGEGLQENVPQE